MQKRILFVGLFFSAISTFPAGKEVDVRHCLEERYFLNPHLEMLKQSDPVPFDSIFMDKYQKQFVAFADNPVVWTGYDDQFYWFRFSIKNSFDHPVDLRFLMGQIGLVDGEMFQSVKNGWVSLGRIGYQYPFETRPYQYTHYVYPLTLSPNTTHTFYYTTDERHAFRVIANALLSPKEMQKAAMEFYTFFGLIIGVLALFFLFNTYLFFTTSDRIHLWYALYIFLEIIFLFKHDGLDAQFLHMDSVTGYRLFGMGAVSAWMVACLMHVIQKYLSRITSNTYLYKITATIKWIIVVMGTIHFLVFYFRTDAWIEGMVLEITTKFMSVGLVAIIINGMYSTYKGHNGGWLVLIGLGVFLIGALERVLLSETTTYIFPPNLFQIGMVIETAVISFGLIYRYRLYQKEKDRMKVELQLEKSNKVGEIIGAQEDERKRIAEDLHDDLGSNLAVIQLNLQSLKSDDTRKGDILRLVEDTATRVRQISHNLMPPQFLQVPLEDIVRAHFEQLNEESMIDFRFHQTGKSFGFSKEEELILYRVIMELTSNILKHSKATEATIQLFFNTTLCELVVEDNGVGFDPKVAGGIGLRNIKSRVKFLQGKMAIDTGAKGTTVIISIPIIKQHS
ncbi:MAG: 7TM diverse intracellular signaling domain-containing protein [Marinoscillum sp.]